MSLEAKLLESIRDEIKGTNQRLDQTNQRLDQTNERLETGFVAVNQRLDQTNQHLDQTNQRLDQTNQHLDQTNQRLDQTNQHLDQTNQRLETGLADVSQRLETGFAAVNLRIDQSNERFSAAVDTLGDLIAGTNKRIDSVDGHLLNFRAEVMGKFDGIGKLLLADSRDLEQFDQRIVKLEVRVDKLEGLGEAG